MEQALSDVKVIDLTHYIAGPYCTKMLADYGADVIKIEKPGAGDPARRMGPFFKDDPNPEKSGLFLHLNTNKKGITLNLNCETGKSIFRQLLKGADILVESFTPGIMANFGLDYPTLEKINPGLVMTSISNFGQSGPYRDFKISELILDGMAHVQYASGQSHRQPLKMGGNCLLYQSGLMAAVATMTALFASRLHGLGQQVDLAIAETHLGSMDRRAQRLVGYQYVGTGEVQPRSGDSIDLAFGFFPCKDGYFDISTPVVNWPRLCSMLDMPELTNNARFCRPDGQRVKENREAFMSIFLKWTMERGKNEIAATGQRYRNFIAPVHTPEDLLKDGHMQARQYFVEIEHPVVGKVKYPGAPIRMEGSPWHVTRPAPLLGQHNEEVYGQLGYGKDDLVKLRETGVV